MVVYVIRHAAAADREDGRSDAERSLTEYGIARMKTVAKGLRRIGIAPEVIYTSPLVRAEETAEILGKTLGGDCRVERCEVLKPGHGPADVIEFLSEGGAGEVAVVGHEPQLGELVALMVTGRTKETVDMKKSAVTRVDFDGRPVAGRGVVLWHIVPAVFERLAGK